MRALLGIFTVLLCLHSINGLDNGLALTPPMGFMTWQRYRCITDCDKYPDECISDNLVRKTADAMVDKGFLAAGYEYIIIDDCWLEKERSRDGYLVADRKRFPHGMKSLSQYVHSKGLKFGIYEDYGTETCQKYPGIYGNEKKDLTMFAEWEIDYIKIDGCYYSGTDYAKGYEELKNILNATGRPIVYSCSYPAYDNENSVPIDYGLLAENCNLWRNWDDIDDSWESVKQIMHYFALKQEYISQFAGPGHWNDPDMLLIGNYGLSLEQSKVQMAVWAILAAPLLMSTDLVNIRPEHQEILLNERIIKVNQDPLGIPGMRVFKRNAIEVWTRKVTPHLGKNYSFAIAFCSMRTDGAPYQFETTLKRIGLTHSGGYQMKDLFSGNVENATYFPSSNITVRINPSGVVFFKATIQST